MKKKNIIFLISWLTTVILVAAFSGCDLPRDNPLDPKAYNYQITQDIPILTVNSYHEWVWFPLGHQYFLEMIIEGSIVDIADSVFVNIDGYYQSLYKIDDFWYNSVISEIIPENNLFNLVGKPLYGIVYYDDGNPIETKETHLIRVIEETPLLLDPNNSMVEIQPIQFEWDPINVNYYCTLEFILYYNPHGGMFSIEIFRESDLPMNTVNYTLEDSLSPDDYIWTISILDYFDNISQSGEAYFKVVQ